MSPPSFSPRARALLGVATFFAAIFFAVVTALAFYFVWVFLNILDDDARKDFFGMLAAFLDYGNTFLTLELFSLLLLFVLYRIYRKHLRHNRELTTLRRTLWHFLLFFFGPYAMIAYYLRHIIEDEEPSNAMLLSAPSAFAPRGRR